MSNISPYLASIRLAFLKMLAYRLRYFTGIITYFLFVSVHYFIWQAIYKNGSNSNIINDNFTIKGFTFSEMVTYVAIAWIARSLYFSDIDEDIAEHVRTGQISTYLLRPVKFHYMMLAEAFGGLLFRLFFFTIPISLVLLSVYPVLLPKDILAGILFFISIVVSFFIFAEINFLLGLLCFRLKSVEGITRAKYFFIQLFSGLLLPIAFLPNYLRQIFEILPFRLIAGTPLDIYLGHISGYSLISTFLFMLFWCGFLFFLCEYYWKKAFKHLSIQGG